MSTKSGFGKPFHNRTRLSEDGCAKEQDFGTNDKAAGYNVHNYWGKTTDNSSTYHEALDEPGMMHSTNYDGFRRNINTDSEIRNGQKGNILTHDGERRQLDTRIFPGPGYSTSQEPGQRLADALNNAWNPTLSKDKGPVNRSKTIDRFEPLVPWLRGEVQNTKHLVPEYWVRGGMDTRAVVRNIDYLKSCGIKK